MCLSYWIDDLFPDCRNEEDEGEEETEGAEYNVACCQEHIITSKCISCRHDEELFALKWSHLELIINSNRIVASLKAILNCSVNLTEISQASRSHPDHQSL